MRKQTTAVLVQEDEQWRKAYNALRRCTNRAQHNTVEQAKAFTKKWTVEKGHGSALEHMTYTFDIKYMARLVLQHVARHRMASPTVESTRYTLRKMLEGWDSKFSGLTHAEFCEYMLLSEKDQDVTVEALNLLFAVISYKTSRGDVEEAKELLPEGWFTTLYMTINARSLRNVLKLRTHPSASPATRQWAYAMGEAIPECDKFLFTDVIFEDKRVTVVTGNTDADAFTDCVS